MKLGKFILNICFKKNMFLWGFILIYVGCGSSNAHLQDLPQWILHPPSRCAVGSMKVQSSHELTKLGAVSRGRAALSYQIRTKVESIMMSYLAEGETLKQQVSQESLKSYSAQSTEVALQGTSLRNHFTAHEPQQIFYALVCIEQEAVMNIFNRMSLIPPQHQKALRERAKQAFAELNQLIPDP